MSDKVQQDSAFRLRDLLIILVCLAGVLYFLYLFRLDLFQTVNSRNEKPAGKITIKHNTVQRRLRDRVLWDRLRNESPVYSGDVIRVANLSDATINLSSNYVSLSENTIIRIRRAADGTDVFYIDLVSGNLTLVAGTEGGIILNIMGRQVKAEPGTVLNASAVGDAMKVQVSKGRALFIDKDQTRELTTSMMIAMDSEGKERTEPAVAVRFPQPNAYLLNDSQEPLNIDFDLNRYYLRPEQVLRLEIAEDRNFSRIAQTIEGPDPMAGATVDSGQWYWRLSLEDVILSTGQFTIADAAGPELLTPIMNQRFYFQTTPPVIRFQWSKVAEASSYILEISDKADFNNIRIQWPTEVEFSTESNLEEGTWYWRVLPVFPVVFEGNAAFSSVYSFRIERGEPPEEPVLRLNTQTANAPEDTVTDMTDMTYVIDATDSTGITNVTDITDTVLEPSPPLPPPPVPAAPSLIAPAQRASTPGPTTSRQQTEVQGADSQISVAEPQRLTAPPVTLLSAPGNRLPQNGYRFNIEELKNAGAIVFRWQAVPDANAYIFTLYQQTSNGQRQIFSNAPENRLSWTLDDFSMLDGQGTFIWQIEAVNMRRDGTIEQRGRPGENSFIMDIPRAGPVTINEPGVLYGN
jgi:hypothetical protein